MLFEKDYNKQMEHNYFIFIAFTMHEKLQIYKKKQIHLRTIPCPFIRNDKKYAINQEDSIYWFK